MFHLFLEYCKHTKDPHHNTNRKSNYNNVEFNVIKVTRNCNDNNSGYNLLTNYSLQIKIIAIDQIHIYTKAYCNRSSSFKKNDQNQLSEN